MRKIVLREDIEPLVIQGNGCTNPIRIHPVRNDVIAFRRDEWRNNRNSPLSDLATLIKLDGRQWWTCFYYDQGEHGWFCERDNIYMRLSEKDFIRQFGKITVVGNGRERYHEECEEWRD